MSHDARRSLKGAVLFPTKVRLGLPALRCKVSYPKHTISSQSELRARNKGRLRVARAGAARSRRHPRHHRPPRIRVASPSRLRRRPPESCGRRRKRGRPALREAACATFRTATRRNRRHVKEAWQLFSVLTKLTCGFASRTPLFGPRLAEMFGFDQMDGAHLVKTEKTCHGTAEKPLLK